jgi:hypothetical protein|tara:strand:+ start:4567 stop:5199 length:633 start_codon:yes stop_codon:yes gene_type:complete
MKAEEIIELALNSELKQLKIGQEPLTVLGYLNMGILEIHKRFNLIQQEAILTMVADKVSYFLDGTDTDVAIDLSRNSFLKVDEIYDYDGQLLLLNDEMTASSLSTPEYNVIDIPSVAATPTQALSIIYRATPNFLLSVKAVIPLPLQFTEALLCYIGYRAHGSLKTGDRQAPGDDKYYKKFVNSCNQIKADGMVVQDSLKCHKFDIRGFV